jgi:hypothetical protein
MTFEDAKQVEQRAGVSATAKPEEISNLKFEISD